MKHAVIAGMFLIILAGAFAVSAVSAATMVLSEVRITTNTASQENPDIWGDRIVWRDTRNDNGDIYLFNVTTSAETRITTDPANQTKPKIYGDHIVYMDNRNNGNWDIYVYDLGTGTESPVANGTASQQNPAIYGNRVVWQDNRNGEWDIFMYDLETHTESQITSSTPETRFQNPAISGTRIVYGETVILDNTCCPDDQKQVTGLYQGFLDTIYGRDLSQGLLYVTTNVHGQAHPAISGDNAVWVGNRYFDVGMIVGGQVVYRKTLVPGVFMKNIATNTVWNSSGTTEQENPDIYGNYIVWQGKKGYSPGDWDITIYDLDSQAENQVTNNTAQQQNPAIYGNSIVYQDNRNGNWDIYLTQFGYVPSLPGPGDNQTAAQGSLYVASYPSNATILINGTERGQTDQAVTNVTAGNVNLTLVKDGYQPYTTIVSVPADDVKVLAPITLVKGGGASGSTGSLYVASLPINATIFIDSVDFGKTNKFVTSVPSGNRTLILTKNGYEPYSGTVTVPAGGLKVLAPVTLSQASPEACTCPCMLCLPDSCLCVA